MFVMVPSDGLRWPGNRSKHSKLQTPQESYYPSRDHSRSAVNVALGGVWHEEEVETVEHH
eukprot:2286714-Amphidinium_carterae.1